MKGVYLFSEGERHLYVGRSDNFRRRYGHHSNPGSNPVPAGPPVRSRLPGRASASTDGYARGALNEFRHFLFEEHVLGSMP